MSLDPIAPEDAAERLVEMSADVRYAVLVDPAGGLVAASDPNRERARRFAGLAHELVGAADAAAPRPAEGGPPSRPADDASRTEPAGNASRTCASGDVSPRPTDALEAQVAGGTVFMARDGRYALVCVARRLSLPALVLYDLRQTLHALEAPG